MLLISDVISDDSGYVLDLAFKFFLFLNIVFGLSFHDTVVLLLLGFDLHLFLLEDFDLLKLLVDSFHVLFLPVDHFLDILEEIVQ